ncbi:site-2 protease family protein [Stieleria sp. TO1_6]|uniref:site-2 protease family protein n=1 Tax=Stieleria tagensis TaxID=2956795 RepID=UPI00209A9C7D|nr:site-2 protease family protein [Stieleria tagensis]MCO8120176.1 site-2 protease family protein [Stieleria tagensis]
MFFKLSAPHVSFAEYLYEGNWITKPIVLVIACFVKLFRIPIPSSTDIPPVASLQPFRIAGQALKPELMTALTGLDQQLADMGFTRIDWIGIHDVQNNTRYGGAAYRSADGDTVAWVRYRLWPNLEKHNRFARLALYSLGPGGKIVLTTAATRDLIDPPDWAAEYHPKVDPPRLRELHQNHLRDALGNARPMIANESESAFDLLEHTHEEFVAFQVKRGVFVPGPAANPIVSAATERAAVAAGTAGNSSVAYPAASQAGAFDDAVPLAELVPDDAPLPSQPAPEASPVDELQPLIDAVRHQETKQSGWLTKILLLAVSIAFFVGLGAMQWDIEMVLLLVPILLVHELGHYVAMKLFGYKNIHMFFIPLLGAAVSGRNYRVSGWKKAIVALAGPLPSIAIGLLLGVVGWATGNELCFNAALFTLILNVMNLAPFLPLDGGQVAHLTLFSRSKVMDLLFRIMTIGMLLAFAAWSGEPFLFGIGFAMMVGLPTVWRTTKATELVRGQTLPEPTQDKMPVEAIRIVSDAVEQAKLPTQGTTALAKLVLSVYENVTVRPPNWPATLGLWALYFTGLVSGIIGLFTLAVVGFGNDLFDEFPEFQSQHLSVPLSDGDFKLGQPAAEPGQTKLDLLAWRFPDADSASAAFTQLTENTDDSVSRLGDVVFTSRPTRSMAADPQAEFDLDFVAQAQAVERQANEDPRLESMDDAIWRRSFATMTPELMVVVDNELADQLTTAADDLPDPIGQFVPIAPWTPKRSLTDKQRDLQTKLRVLQGRSDSVPWDSAEPQSVDITNDPTTENFRQQIRRSADRAKQVQQDRLDWIDRQADTAQGSAGRLYKAYAQYEQALKLWREDERAYEQKGESPQPKDYLQPLLTELGYLAADSPLLATSVLVEAYVVEEDLMDETPQIDPLPRPGDGQSLVSLYLSPTQDAAAAFASVHAWLKKQGVRQVVWKYQVPIQTE